MESSGDWIVHVQIAVPRAEAATIDDAIDAVGEKLAPLYWTGHLHEPAPTC